jgi:hypothetical protein
VPPVALWFPPSRPEPGHGWGPGTRAEHRAAGTALLYLLVSLQR